MNIHTSVNVNDQLLTVSYHQIGNRSSFIKHHIIALRAGAIRIVFSRRIHARHIR